MRCSSDPGGEWRRDSLTCCWTLNEPWAGVLISRQSSLGGPERVFRRLRASVLSPCIDAAPLSSRRFQTPGNAPQLEVWSVALKTSEMNQVWVIISAAVVPFVNRCGLQVKLLCFPSWKAFNFPVNVSSRKMLQKKCPRKKWLDLEMF